jgi:hypothetical protein
VGSRIDSAIIASMAPIVMGNANPNPLSPDPGEEVTARSASISVSICSLSQFDNCDAGHGGDCAVRKDYPLAENPARSFKCRLSATGRRAPVRHKACFQTYTLDIAQEHVW